MLCCAVADSGAPCSLYVADADIISMDAYVEEPRGVVVGVTFVVKVSGVVPCNIQKNCFETILFLYYSLGNFLFQGKSGFNF